MFIITNVHWYYVEGHGGSESETSRRVPLQNLYQVVPRLSLRENLSVAEYVYLQIHKQKSYIIYIYIYT